MAQRRRWSDLSEDTRRRIVLGGTIEAVLKTVALVDLKRRPAAEIRGRKWVWAIVLIVVNSAGAVPLGYFLWGRQR
jgi:hypothetical protein